MSSTIRLVLGAFLLTLLAFAPNGANALTPPSSGNPLDASGRAQIEIVRPNFIFRITSSDPTAFDFMTEDDVQAFAPEVHRSVHLHTLVRVLDAVIEMHPEVHNPEAEGIRMTPGGRFLVVVDHLETKPNGKFLVDVHVGFDDLQEASFENLEIQGLEDLGQFIIDVLLNRRLVLESKALASHLETQVRKLIGVLDLNPWIEWDVEHGWRSGDAKVSDKDLAARALNWFVNFGRSTQKSRPFNNFLISLVKPAGGFIPKVDIMATIVRSRFVERARALAEAALKSAPDATVNVQGDVDAKVKSIGRGNWVYDDFGEYRGMSDWFKNRFQLLRDMHARFAALPQYERLPSMSGLLGPDILNTVAYSSIQRDLETCARFFLSVKAEDRLTSQRPPLKLPPGIPAPANTPAQ